MNATAQQLLLAAKQNHEALGPLLEQYRHYLRLLARIEIGKRMQGKVDASDIVQEAFLDAHRYFGNFRGTEEAQFAAWLREILAGTLANQVRRYFGTKARDLRLEVGMAQEVERSHAGMSQLFVDSGTSPSRQVDRQEQSLLVAEALSRLPEHYQAVLVLRHLEGLTFPEIAARLGRTVDSVEKLWLRGLASLKKEFGGGS